MRHATTTRDLYGGSGRGGRGAGGAAARPIYEATRYDVNISVPKDKPAGTARCAAPAFHDERQ